MKARRHADMKHNDAGGFPRGEADGRISDRTEIIGGVVTLVLVMLGTSSYLVITHLIFPELHVLETHIAIILVDSLVATAVAYFVFRRIRFLTLSEQAGQERWLKIIRSLVP